MAELQTPGTIFFSRHLFEFLRDEEEAVLKATNDLDREAVMAMYHKSKITLEDIQREYTPEEKRMLCERTKVRVKMYALNTVWDAKKRFDKKKRLENRSESFVNRMFVKAHKRSMVKPYSDLERERYKVLAACQTKKENNARLDRWKRQHLKACKSNGLNGCCELSANISIDSTSEEEYDAEVLTVAPTKSMPPVLVEPTQAPLESQPQSESDEGTMGDLLEPIPPAPLESQPQSQSSESAMDELLQRVLKKPPAQKPLPNVDSGPNLWGIGDEQEVEVDVEEGNDGPPAHAVEKELNSYDWHQLGNGINSESLSMGINLNTQNTQNTQNTEPPDYECFGTQVVAASTQDTVESQQFF